MSISAIPGGSPVALADPEGYASSYLVCGGCHDHTCDRCAKKAPPIGPHTPCPKCGGALRWEGVPLPDAGGAGAFGAPMASPPSGGGFGAPMASPAAGGAFGAPMGSTAPGGAFGAPMGSTAPGGAFGAPMASPAASTAPGGAFGAPMASPPSGGGFGAPMASPPSGGGFGAPMASPPSGGGFGAPMASPPSGGGFGAPMASPPVPSGPGREPVAANLSQIPPDVVSKFQKTGNYLRSAPLETLFAEVLGLEAWAVAEKAKTGRTKMLILLGLLAAFPAALCGGLAGRAIERHGGFILGAGAAFVLVSVVVLWIRSNVKSPYRSTYSTRRKIFRLVAKLVLAPGSDVAIVEDGFGEKMKLQVTLASGVQAQLARVGNTTSRRSGRYLHTTTTADDQIKLLFAAGRFPHVQGLATALQQQLSGMTGGRAKVQATATELSVTLPVSMKPSEKPASDSMPPLIELLHGMLEPNVTVVNANGLPPSSLVR
ncbi:MAG: hypothetical protein H6719_24030 [Sandaracinaceae bacterium]|nr:hypothetical protein [Sandaracinaceae bacterium]